MSKPKKIYLLSGILLVICAATFAISKYETHKENIKNSEEIILTLDTDTVTALSWEYNEETLAFHKEESWLYDEDENFPVDPEKISSFLEQFQEFGVSFIIEDVEDYGQYGLDEPLCTIHITTEEQAYEIQLGNYSNMDSERYVSIGDGNVYLVKHDPLEEFDAEISELIQHDEFPSFDTADKVQFSGAESYTIVYEEDSTNTYCSDDVYFTDSKPLDTDSVDQYLNAICTLNATDYVSYHVTEEELEDYGLSDPELTISISYTKEAEEEETEDSAPSSETFVLHVGRNQEELKEAQESDEEDAEERNWYYQEEELDIFDFRTSLYALTADSFTNEKPKQKEEISLTVYLENETYPEISIRLYRYDGNNCLAVVDGKPVSLVSRSSVIDLAEAVNAIVLN